MNEVLLTLGSISIALWGIAHIVPTRSVVTGFGTLTTDNLHIITMEWVAEGLTLVFIGVLVLFLTLADHSEEAAAIDVIRLAAVMLLVMAGWSLFTGARTSVLPMKLCPLVKTTVAAVFVLGTLV
jgi:hypothetical protein